MSLQLYLLADTTLHAASVDEVAAEHVNAGCVIHYGHATLAAVRGTPAYFVFPRAAASAAAVCDHVDAHLAQNEAAARAGLVVLMDLSYMHLRDDIAERLQVPVPLVCAAHLCQCAVCYEAAAATSAGISSCACYQTRS